MHSASGAHGPIRRNRWLVVAAAIVLNLALGAVYSWPVFSNYLTRVLTGPEQWKHFETQLVFSMSTVFLAVGVILAGQLSERHKPRTLILIGAVLIGGGYALGGILPLDPVTLVATLGAMVGLGTGVAYALPITLAARWFPDRKGLATGLSMAGFGTGSVLWSQLFDLFLDERIGLRSTFILYGAIFAVLILGTRRFLTDPPPGFHENLKARLSPGTLRRIGGPAAGGAGASENGGEGFPRGEIVKHGQLYFLMCTFMTGSAIGLMIIGMSKTYPVERLTAAGYPEGAASALVSLAALVLFPVFNGGGRIVFGWLADLLGWKPVLTASYALQSVVLFAFPRLMGAPVTVFAGLLLLALCYGGNFTIFPVTAAHLWGSRHLAGNYSLVFIAFGVGALIGPSLSGAARDSGMLDFVFILCGALLAVGAVFSLILRKPEKQVG